MDQRAKLLAQAVKKYGSNDPRGLYEELRAQQVPIDDPFMRKLESQLDIGKTNVESGNVEQNLLFVDDVTRLNATSVERVFYCRNEEDIKNALKLARRDNRKVSLRGTRHSMGGHTIAGDGYVLDVLNVSDYSFDQTTGLLTTGPGALWSDLILFLNQYGYSPRTMQSYSTFSVGGSLSVNAHGITTDYAVSECVRDFELIKWDGTKVMCKRDGKGESGELFRLALGGYGMFGVISQITMKVNNNTHLEMEMIQTNVKSFPKVFENVINKENSDVEIKLSRLDVSNPDEIDMFLFRRNCQPGIKTVSKLGLKPREMSMQSQLLYKWVLPSAKTLRGDIERARGGALDWSTENERNTLMYESADTLSLLYESVLTIDDTFILQEYFIPRSKFSQWMKKAKDIYVGLKNDNNEKPIHLLNTTIRFVEKDEDTFLSYARASEGVFAFVLYYRIQRTREADEALAKVHSAFVKITLELSGTFYLPYRHHYSNEQMDKAYPMMKEFIRLKQKYDPHCLFESKWYQRYGARFWKKTKNQNDSTAMMNLDTKSALVPKPVKIISQRRNDSYGNLLRSLDLRKRFREEFLVNIFNSLDNEKLFRLMRQAWLENAGKGDNYVFRRLKELVDESSTNVALVTRLFKQLLQLNRQKLELESQTRKILSNLGRINKVNGYISIGDSGKMVRSLIEDGCGVGGKIWVCHDSNPDSASGNHPSSLNDVVERASEEPVGEFVEIEYKDFDKFSLDPIPSNSADLLTMNAGLHHFPQDKLTEVLGEVYRVLRPSGIFILREHDCSEDLIPMLDLAHSVFNVLTGVSARADEEEIRAFRSLSEWRSIVTDHGFVDTMLFEVEIGDPTKDVMTAFVKPPYLSREETSRVQLNNISHEDMSEFKSISMTVAQKLGLRGMKNAFPEVVLGFSRRLLKNMEDFLLSLDEYVQKALSTDSFSSFQTFALQTVVNNFIKPGKIIIGSLQVQFGDRVQVKDNVDLGIRIPVEEIFLIVNHLIRKGESGRASVEELELISIIKNVKKFCEGMIYVPSTPTQVDSINTTEGMKEKDENVVSKEERVEELVTRILVKMPELESLDLSTVGFPKPVSKMNVFGRNKSQIINVVSEKLDNNALLELENAVEILLDDVDSELNKFTFENIKNSRSIWNEIAMIFLGAPDVQFSSLGIFQAKLIGLNEIVVMWEEAQRRRKMESNPSTATAIDEVNWEARSNSNLKADVRSSLKQLDGSLRSERIQFNVDNDDINTVELRNVSEIVSATLRPKAGLTLLSSMTLQKYDCTTVISDYLQVDGTVVLPLTKDFVGQVVNSKENLPSFIGRNVSNVLSSSAYKNYELTIEYNADSKGEESVHMLKVGALLDKLDKAGVVQDLHGEDGEYTWYKLSEWMQVEILNILGDSLEHTPWFRFPFMEFLSLYFRVLLKESDIVREKHGSTKAYFSMAFLTDVIPGFVMAILFGQLQLLALPLKTFLGDSYQQETMYEELVVRCSSNSAPKWHAIDARIKKVKRILPKLYAVQVPTFKGMTEVLMKLAEYRVDVLQISNNKECQVRVEVESSQQVDEIRDMPGCKVMFEYQYPVDGTPNTPLTTVSVGVDVPYLLNFIRACKNSDIAVKQIYDFWC